MMLLFLRCHQAWNKDLSNFIFVIVFHLLKKTLKILLFVLYSLHFFPTLAVGKKCENVQ